MIASSQTIDISNKEYEPDTAWFSNTLLPAPQPLSGQIELLDNLIVSSTSPSGGILALGKGTNPTIRYLDRMPTSGMSIDHNSFVRSIFGRHLILGLHSKEGVYMISDERAGGVHDVKMQFGQIFAVSTGTNEIVQLNKTGDILHRWKFPGEGDVWHLNCIDFWDDRYVVSCFGRFEHFGQWREQRVGSGIVFDLETEKILWDGLSEPHHPKRDKYGRQYVCDSFTHRLLRRDPDGTNQRELSFPGAFTRGLAMGRNRIYVGLSRMRLLDRQDTGIPNARIAVVDRDSFEKISEIDLPCPEVYDIICMPDAFDI